MDITATAAPLRVPLDRLIRVHHHDLLRMGAVAVAVGVMAQAQRQRHHLRHLQLHLPVDQQQVDPRILERRTTIPNRRRSVALKDLDPLAEEEVVELEAGADEIEPDLPIHNQHHHHRRHRLRRHHLTDRHRHHHHKPQHLLDHLLQALADLLRLLRGALRRRQGLLPSQRARSGHRPFRRTDEQDLIPNNLPMTRKDCEISRSMKTLRN